jgi:hypothetical protein
VPKQIAAGTMEGTKKRERSHTIWRDESEEDLNIMGIKNRQAMARDRREWRKFLLEARVHNIL